MAALWPNRDVSPIYRAVLFDQPLAGRACHSAVSGAAL
jgi:hypothetical protein